MGIREPYTLSSPTSGDYLNNPPHHTEHSELTRFVSDSIPVILPNSEAVVAAQMFGS